LRYIVFAKNDNSTIQWGREHPPGKIYPDPSERNDGGAVIGSVRADVDTTKWWITEYIIRYTTAETKFECEMIQNPKTQSRTGESDKRNENKIKTKGRSSSLISTPSPKESFSKRIATGKGTSYLRTVIPIEDR
jgi:hypothetical protein